MLQQRLQQVDLATVLSCPKVSEQEWRDPGFWSPPTGHRWYCSPLPGPSLSLFWAQSRSLWSTDVLATNHAICFYQTCRHKHRCSPPPLFPAQLVFWELCDGSSPKPQKHPWCDQTLVSAALLRLHIDPSKENKSPNMFKCFGELKDF